MISRKHLAGTTAVLAAVSLAAGVGLASGSNGASPPDLVQANRQVTNEDVHPGSSSVLAAFSTFSRPAADSVATPSQQTELRNALGADAGADFGAIGHADYSMARSAPIAGSPLRAWLVPSGDQVCIILPDPGSGYAATCHTLAEIKAGKGILTLTPRADSKDTPLVGAIVPDGSTAPTLASDARSTRLSASDNIAASTAALADHVGTPAGQIPVSGD
jgi:hypothetical protein